MRRSARLSVFLFTAACLDTTGGAVPVPLPPFDSSAVVLVGAGDIANCTSGGDAVTAELLDHIEGVVFTAGDNAYQSGTAQEYAQCYGPSWGRHRQRTRPTPGNHDYVTDQGAPYYTYFGANAGPSGLGYYSYELGTWHIIALNSNLPVTAGSQQETWLRADLGAHRATCTLAYWHIPRFSSGRHSSNAQLQPLWQALYDSGADVVVNGHDHDYERFAPQTPAGALDSARGIREFVVGVGGANVTPFAAIVPNSEVRDASTFGVLAFNLKAGGFDWQFIPAGGTFADAGSGTCH